MDYFQMIAPCGLDCRKIKKINLSCRKIIFCILTFFLFAFLTEDAVCEQPKKWEYRPTSGWRSSAPEMQGILREYDDVEANKKSANRKSKRDNKAWQANTSG